MHRFYVNEELSGKTRFELADSEAVRKIKKILRLKPGDKLVLFDSAGNEFAANITSISARAVAAVIETSLHRAVEPETRLILYPSLFKKNRFEWMLEKCTEIGVEALQPILSEHGVVKTFEIPERWHKIVEEAARQSGRTTIPNILNPSPLQKTLENISTGTILVAAEQTPTSLELKEMDQPLHLFVGPEGGWSAAELELFKEHGARFWNLGSRILRAETACIVFSAFCIYAENRKDTDVGTF